MSSLVKKTMLAMVLVSTVAVASPKDDFTLASAKRQATTKFESSAQGRVLKLLRYYDQNTNLNDWALEKDDSLAIIEQSAEEFVRHTKGNFVYASSQKRACRIFLISDAEADYKSKHFSIASDQIECLDK